jgi:hypothetical protein
MSNRTRAIVTELSGDRLGSRQNLVVAQILSARYEAANEDFEYVLATHKPGRIASAHQRLLDAAVALEKFYASGEIPPNLTDLRPRKPGVAKVKRHRNWLIIKGGL